MSSEGTSSEEENLAAYAGVAVSGEAVKAHAANSGKKAAKVSVLPPHLSPADHSLPMHARSLLPAHLPHPVACCSHS